MMAVLSPSWGTKLLRRQPTERSHTCSTSLKQAVQRKYGCEFTAHSHFVTLVVLLSPVTVSPCVTGAWTTRCLWFKIGCLALQRCPCVSLYCIYWAVFLCKFNKFQSKFSAVGGKWACSHYLLISLLISWDKSNLSQQSRLPLKLRPYRKPFTSTQSQKFSHSQSATQPPTLLISRFPSRQARRGAIAAVFGII